LTLHLITNTAHSTFIGQVTCVPPQIRFVDLAPSKALIKYVEDSASAAGMMCPGRFDRLLLGVFVLVMFTH
jgi:hypothetical protein